MKQNGEKMKILITGAAGFIGSQLAYKLWKEKEALILIDNYSYGNSDNLIFDDHDFTNEVMDIDIRDAKKMEELFRENEISYVYNLAGIAPLPDCQSNPTEAIDVNVTGFVNILENARKYGVKKIIQASTNALYENTTVFPTTEQEKSEPTLIYPNTKLCAEKFAKSFCDTYGMSVVCLRFANVYGPHIDCLRKQPPFVAYMIRELFFDRTPIFHSDGNQKRDYIYVDDLINLAMLVRQGHGFDVVNCSSNQNSSVNEMYSLAQKLMGKEIKQEYASNQHFWEKYPDLFNGIYKIDDNILREEINKYTLCDNSYGKNKYHWAPVTTIETGLQKVIEHECKLLSKL